MKHPLLESESGMALQICFLTENLEKSNEWWSTITGMPLGEIWESHPWDVTHCTYLGEPIPGTHRQVIYRYKGMFIELIEPSKEKNTWRDWLEKHGEGFHHIGFRVPDIDKSRDSLEAEGYKTLQTGDFPGGQYLYSDTEADGNFIVELLRFEPDFAQWLEEKFPIR